ncbi:hypothetical protein [Pseudomonas brenneri]|uniref:hypothetical protein n=1 Tax=Pseudomonas brenneri TaxID=129817 RepID=UPI003BA26F8A
MNLSPVTASRIFDSSKFMLAGFLAYDIRCLPVEPAQPKPVDHVPDSVSKVDVQAVIDALAGLTTEQRDAVQALIEAERQHASRWWAYLNEMRFSDDLPDWVKAQCVGTHPDFDRWDKDRERLNLALFGSKDLYPLGSFRSVRFDL